MLQIWACDACKASNQFVVSLLTPPPDTVVRMCATCGHGQEIRIPEQDPELPARQRRRKIESFVRTSVATG